MVAVVGDEALDDFGVDVVDVEGCGWGQFFAEVAGHAVADYAEACYCRVSSCGMVLMQLVRLYR